MAAVTPRFLWQNFTQLGNTLFRASSTLSGRSVKWLRHQLRSKTWRSAQGWTFAKGFNDVLRIDEGTDERVVYVDGSYSSGATAAAAIEAAITAGGVDPGELTPSLWLKADAIQQKNASVLTSWPDSSGNARNLDTIVGTPTFYRDILNGRPCVRFNEDGYAYAAASAVQMDDLDDAGNTGYGTVFVVGWVDSDHTGPSALWAQADDNRGLFVDASDDVVARAYDGTQDNATITASAAGAWRVFAWQYNGTNVIGMLDDLDTAAETTTASGAQTTLTQDFYVGSDGANHWKGYIAELIVIPSSLSEENRRRVTQYLEQKYALSTATTAATWANTYTAAYSTSTKKFTLARATGASTMGLMWTDAHWLGRSMGLDLGFLVAADDTGATTYDSDAASYQSRHSIEVDFGQSLGVTSSVVINHNAGSGGTFTIEANDEPFWEDTPDFTDTLLGPSRPEDMRIEFFAEQQKRYWRLVIDDTTNVDGFSEVGIWYLGSYFEPGQGYSGGWASPRKELSQVGFSDHGAPYMDDKPTAQSWRVIFRPLSETDKDSFESMAAYVKTSRLFFAALDPLNKADETFYVHAEPIAPKHLKNSTTLYQVELHLKRAPL